MEDRLKEVYRLEDEARKFFREAKASRRGISGEPGLMGLAQSRIGQADAMRAAFNLSPRDYEL